MQNKSERKNKHKILQAEKNLALLEAVTRNKLEQVKKALADGADINTKDDYERTPLILATYAENPKMFKLLLGAGADVNAKNDCGETALFHARKATIVRILIDAGADINIENDDKITPLLYIYNEKIAKILIAAGAKITPEIQLFLSCRFGHTEKVKELIRQRINVNSKKGKNLSTPLMDAASAEIAQILIDAGADVNAQNKNGFTSLIYASRANKTEMIKILLNAGADITAKDKEFNMTPLMWAVLFSNIEATKMLIAAGSDVNVTDNCDQCPLDTAKNFVFDPKIKKEIISILKAAGAVEKKETPQKYKIGDIIPE